MNGHGENIGKVAQGNPAAYHTQNDARSPIVQDDTNPAMPHERSGSPEVAWEGPTGQMAIKLEVYGFHVGS
jgi:hypothetical protein